jgi:hypothetical protein
MAFKSPPMDGFKDVPGKIIVEIQEVRPQFRGMGFTLEKLRKILGGDEGYVTDPYHGKDHKVSLKKWLNSNFSTVELTVFFDFQPDPEYMRQHPEKFLPGNRNKEDADLILDNTDKSGTQSCS